MEKKCWIICIISQIWTKTTQSRNWKQFLFFSGGYKDWFWAYILTQTFFIYIDNEFAVHETDCSVKCGNGTKTVTIVHCSENQDHEVECKSIPEKKQIPCDTQIECPIKYQYSQWGSWTQCSRHSIYNRTVSYQSP